MKALIFDSGVLITFSMNGMLELLRDLKKSFNGKFLITHDVEREVIEKPMLIKKYKLGAMEVKTLIDEHIIEFPESLNINKKEIDHKTNSYIDFANNLFFRERDAIKLIDVGEASCLALSEILHEKGVSNVIAIDERTTRMLFEKPDNLKNLLEEKLHANITAKKLNIQNGFKFIRSTELIYVGFKKGLVKNRSKDMLDAMLYGAKFRGCAVSDDEIKEIEKL